MCEENSQTWGQPRKNNRKTSSYEKKTSFVVHVWWTEIVWHHIWRTKAIKPSVTVPSIKAPTLLEVRWRKSFTRTLNGMLTPGRERLAIPFGSCTRSLCGLVNLWNTPTFTNFSRGKNVEVPTLCWRMPSVTSRKGEWVIVITEV